MSTYENAPVQYTTVDNIKFAYLLIGPLSNGSTTSSLPLVMNIHFRGTFDHWDPLLINALAANRQVLLIDNAGVGKSGGEVPEQYAGWAAHVIAVTLALGFKEVDVLGFSMGGFVAQLIALDGPKAGLKVRRLIVAGSGPSQGEGTGTGAAEYFQQLYVASTEKENREGFLRTFFSWSDKKQQVGQEWWERMNKARKDRSDYVGEEGTKRQTAAVMKWAGGKDRENGSYDRLHLIKIPVLVANGSNDLLVPTENSITLWRKLVNADAHLHLYPDSGHGFLDEYHEHFSRLVNEFLDEPKAWAERA